MMPESIPARSISAEVLGVLFVTLLASSAVFWLLSRRWTSHRQWVTLAEWARNAGFRAAPCGPGQLPPPLQELQFLPGVRVCLAAKGTMLLQLQTDGAGAAPTGPSGQVIWNVLTKELDWTWPPSGLRPSGAARSLLDLFPLSSFPMLGNTERFIVFGSESNSAATLSQSMARSLLPPDVGLLLHGRHLLLDFSDRPFDELELDRMLALAEQLAQKLPMPPPTPRAG